jgi:flagellar hook-associated protein 3 FlgL
MRVTQQALLNGALERLTSRLSEFGKAQDRLATGKRITRASEDPTGMAQALELRAAQRVREQEVRNAADGRMWLGLADSKLQGVVDRLHRARELAVRAASFTNTDEHAAIAEEIQGIRDEIQALANSRHQGRAIFAGFSTGDAVAEVGGVWVYQGDGGRVERRVGENDVVQVNITGDIPFGFASGKDVFSVLDDLEGHLLANDTSGIDGSIAELDVSLENVLNALATIGAAANRIETAEVRNVDEMTSIRTRLSEIEDVDLAEAVMEMQLQEGAYQAALAAFSRAQQASLIDFLR